jgi:pyruvate formate lyase activating enzyme
VPGYTDQPEYLEKMASDLSIYQNLERIEILPYHTMGEYKYEELGIEYKLKGIEPPTKEEIEKAKAILEKSGKKVFIR